MAENREETLMKNFVSALNEVFKNDFFEFKKDAYKKISAGEFVSLKKALSNINNIVTLKITNLFIEKLRKDEFISNDHQKDEMIENSNKQKANANGYDVEYPDPKKKSNVENPIKILAEVKCNIPVGKTQFGSAQKAGILKDIEGLLNGKEKSKLKAKVGSYFKFMVFMNYEEDGCDVKKSVENLLENTLYKNKVKYYDGKCQLDNDHVYIIFIS